MPSALIIIAQQNYQDKEFEDTRSGLSVAGFEIIIGSKESGECQGSLGGSETAFIAMRDVNVSDYDRIAFIGGPGAHALSSDPDALRIAHETVRANIPLGAICIAPLILAKAKVLEGRKATVWDSGGEQQAVLEQYGATYTGDSVTVDGLIVTANGPAVAEEFGKTLAVL